MAKHSNDGAAAPTKAPNKTQAVRQALARLGADAKPVRIRDYLHKRYQIDMSLNHISNIKSGLARQGAAESGAGTNGRAAGGSRRLTEIALDDLQTVKQLVRRLGAAKLHALVDIVAR